jgi:hypothetical protein
MMHRNEVATLLESVVLILVAGFSLFATDAQARGGKGQIVAIGAAC